MTEILSFIGVGGLIAIGTALFKIGRGVMAIQGDHAGLKHSNTMLTSKLDGIAKSLDYVINETLPAFKSRITGLEDEIKELRKRMYALEKRGK